MKQPIRKRLLDRVKKDSNGCWLWQGTRMITGYGQIWYQGTNTSTHRTAFKAFKGEIPTGLVVCHTCDVRHCVNPEHLFIGTQKDNMQDCSRKNRCGPGRHIELTIENAKNYKQKWYVLNRARLQQEGKMGFKHCKRFGELSND